MTVKELMELLKEYPDDTPIDMIMDWGGDPSKPSGQWEDAIGEVINTGNSLLIANRHFS